MIKNYLEIKKPYKAASSSLAGKGETVKECKQGENSISFTIQASSSGAEEQGQLGEDKD